MKHLAFAIVCVGFLVYVRTLPQSVIPPLCAEPDPLGRLISERKAILVETYETLPAATYRLRRNRDYVWVLEEQ